MQNAIDEFMADQKTILRNPRTFSKIETEGAIEHRALAGGREPEELRRVECDPDEDPEQVEYEIK